MLKYLGTIVVGASASKNNTNTTGTPFLIPESVRKLRVNTLDADLYCEILPSAATLASPASDTTTAAKGRLLFSGADLEVESGHCGAGLIVVLFNAGSGSESAKVYAVG